MTKLKYKTERRFNGHPYYLGYGFPQKSEALEHAAQHRRVAKGKVARVIPVKNYYLVYTGYKTPRRHR